MGNITRTNWTDITSAALATALPLARGSYQRAILYGNESISGSTLRGRAGEYRGRYQDSSSRLLNRLRAAGLTVTTRTEAHGAIVLVVR